MSPDGPDFQSAAPAAEPPPRPAPASRGLLLSALGLLTAVGALAAGKLAGVDAAAWIELARSSPWSLPIVVLAYIVLPLLAVPQFALVVATVAAFGPLWGGLYAWVGTVVSASLGFAIGRALGTPLLERWGGPRAVRLSEAIGRRGLVATLLIRLIPTGLPFALINIAAGASRIPAWAFVLGSVVGAVPKIAAIAGIGGGLLAFLGSGDPRALALAAAALLAWLAALAGLRRALRGLDD